MARSHSLIVALVVGCALLLVQQSNILGVSQRSNKPQQAHARIYPAQTLAEAHFRAARDVLVEEDAVATAGENASEDAGLGGVPLPADQVRAQQPAHTLGHVLS